LKTLLKCTSLKQRDERTPGEVAQMIVEGGFEPVWKDWDQKFITQDVSI